MKKFALLFTFFLFFGILSAEEVEVGEYDLGDVTVTLFAEREPEPEPEKESEEEQQPEVQQDTERKECCCDVSCEISIEKPKLFYFEPSLGFGVGLSAYRPTVNLNADFLVSYNGYINYYIGFDLDFKVSLVGYYGFPLGFGIRENAVFDFMVENNKELRSVGIWIALGLNLFLIDSATGEWEWEGSRHFSCGPAYGAGLDFVFENHVVLKVGLDSFISYYYPDLIILVGYRF